MHDKLLEYLPAIAAVISFTLAFLTAIKVIADTHSSTKTLAYLLVVFFIPILGSIIYFSFGVNYRKKRLYSRKIVADSKLLEEIERRHYSFSQKIALEEKEKLLCHSDMVTFLLNDSRAPLSRNKATLLVNGEKKFPEVIKCLEGAKDFIHIEYYIYDHDEIGTRIAEILMRKVKEGVTVRFIYDDFGSHSIKKSLVREMREAGVKVFPFYKIKLVFFANRINYRDHRKIIIIDGKVGFIGGINVSDRYINNDKVNGRLYWRDTHIKLEGPAVSSLQFNFLTNWNFCSGENIQADRYYFPILVAEGKGEDLVQVVAGGPDYPRPNIMLTYFAAIVSAVKKVYITSPYFIPNDSICDALQKAALSGIDVRLLVPKISDSKFVNAASRSYYGELIASGVKVYLYKKGFVHAKTIMVDENLSIVGTANMDSRSFDLNFEITAVVYSERICSELETSFMKDIEDSDEISLEEWSSRSRYSRFVDKIARLVSPLL